ncbi:MAG: type II secretion system protein [Phycisphaerales bacterium]|nr:MAG: type II secretion system protein [Phycisphaerales bacterium]
MPSHLTTPQRARVGHTRLRAERCAFTLIELLVVVAIIGLLIGVLLPTLSGARDAAKLVVQQGNARQLMMGYAEYAIDRRDYVLPAMIDGNGFPDEIRVAPRDAAGNRIPLSTQPGRRWFWHLAPYLNDAYDVMYRDQDLLEDLYGRNDYYEMTLYPGFGINQRFVGGISAYRTNPLYGRSWGRSWYVQRTYDAKRPSGLMVFVSSAFTSGPTGFRDGYFRVEPPYFTAQNWTTMNAPGKGDEPTQSRNVWPVARGRVVAGFMDGHAEAMEWGRASDMRLWAPDADAPDWRMPPLTP